MNKLCIGSWSAVYTVEASVIVSICLFIVMDTIIFGFDIYEESLKYLKKTQEYQYAGVEMFRLLEAGTSVMDRLKGR